MVEIIVATIGGFFLVLNTYTTQATKRQLKVSNGNPPGFMIEKTYEKVEKIDWNLHELDKRLEVHVLDQQAHCKESQHGPHWQR